MTWFKVDDQLPDNKKSRRVRRSHPSKRRDSAPFGLWALAGAWCGRARNGGFVPLEVLEEWDDDAEVLAQRLVGAGFWVADEVDGEPGYRFHDWADRNPAGEDPADYGQKGNHIRWHVGRGLIDPTCGLCGQIDPNRGDDRGESGGESTRPDPTRPDPTGSKSGATPSTGDLNTASTPPQPPVDDVSIAILASKLRRYTALTGLRVDKLKPAQAARIAELVQIHGDDRLVEVAIRTLRRDDPPQTIQAFLAGWDAIPKPGDPTLAAVPDPPCAEPGHTGTTRHCIQCASERKERKTR